MTKKISSSSIYNTCNAGNASLTLPLYLFVILVFSEVSAHGVYMRGSALKEASLHLQSSHSNPPNQNGPPATTAMLEATYIAHPLIVEESIMSHGDLTWKRGHEDCNI